jgi:hypothetical protein
MTGCERLPLKDKAAIKNAAPDKANLVDAGAIPKRNILFRFLRRKVQGHESVGRDWRKNETGKKEAGGSMETAWDKDQKKSSKPRNRKNESRSGQGPKRA